MPISASDPLPTSARVRHGFSLNPRPRVDVAAAVVLSPVNRDAASQPSNSLAVSPRVDGLLASHREGRVESGIFSPMWD